MCQPQQRPKCPNQRIVFLNLLATSQRVEIERHLAVYNARTGKLDEARICPQRLVEDIQSLSAILISLQASWNPENFSSMSSMLAQHLLLVKTQLSEFEQDSPRLFKAAPTPPSGGPSSATGPASESLFLPVVESRESPFLTAKLTQEPPFSSLPSPDDTSDKSQQSPRARSQFLPLDTKPWSTTDPSFVRTGLQPMLLNEVTRARQTSDDISGCLHTNWRLDGQDDRATQTTQWHIEMDLGAAPDIPKNSRKRHGEDLLRSSSKRRHIDRQLSAPLSGLRGGQVKDEPRNWGFRGTFRDLLGIRSRHKRMYSISNDHINPSTTNNICSDQSLPFGGSLISISALQTVFQPSDHREQATRNALRGLVKLCETTPSRFYPPTQDHVQNQQHRKRLQQVFDALDSISIDSFDAAGTQLTLEDLRAFIKKTCRPATKHADKEAEKEIVLANAAATVADYQDKLDRQREFAAKVFVDGEQTAGVFAEWIRTSRERFGEELEFGERARQKPRPVMQSSGFGNTCVVYVV